jgi:hypothetical protein
MAEHERVPFDIEEFFDQLIEKFEKAKARNLQPVIKESPSWVIAVPDGVMDGQIAGLFTIMAKQADEELQLHYGNTADGQFFLVTFRGVTKEDFIKSVTEIIDHVYGGAA